MLYQTPTCSYTQSLTDSLIYAVCYILQLKHLQSFTVSCPISRVFHRIFVLCPIDFPQPFPSCYMYSQIVQQNRCIEYAAAWGHSDMKQPVSPVWAALHQPGEQKDPFACVYSSTSTLSWQPLFFLPQRVPLARHTTLVPPDELYSVCWSRLVPGWWSLQGQTVLISASVPFTHNNHTSKSESKEIP